MIIANLSLNPDGYQECLKLSLFNDIRKFVVNSAATFVPKKYWTTLQPVIPLLDSNIPEIQLFGIYALKRMPYGSNDVRLWKWLCLNSGISSILKIRNSSDPLAASLAIEWLQYHEITPNMYTTPSRYLTLQQLSGDLNILYKENTTNENPLVRIYIGQYSFAINRHVLSSRSDFFKELLSTWNGADPIIIENISVEVFQKVLEFLYCANTNITWDDAIPILEASDRFEIDTLKHQCEKVLLQTVNKETVENLVCVGDMYSSSNLVTSCEEFILSYWGFFSKRLEGFPSHISENLKQKASEKQHKSM